nr:MAG TPA: hypothetical protein [Caudoviricetes sp.]
MDYLGFSTLPDVNGRYFRAERTPNIKNEQGLPNIYGEFYIRPTSGKSNASGALYKKEYFSEMSGFTIGSAMGNDNGIGSATIVFDASKVNPIYGNSENITPLTYTVRAYICYA